MKAGNFWLLTCLLELGWGLILVAEGYNGVQEGVCAEHDDF